MSKPVHITDKLSFDEHPSLIIKGEAITVNDDAPTMLKIMGLMGEDPGVKDIISAYELMFPAESRKKLDKFKLNLSDLMTVIQEGINLVIGSVPVGEEMTHTTISLKTTT